MVKIVTQTITLPASPQELFTTYVDAKKHTAMTGGTVRISKKVGATFTAFNGMLRGRNLMIVPNRMIVQSWRAKAWKKRDPDSILMLLFRKAGRGGKIELIHVGMPHYDYLPIKKGWPKYYWRPWKTYRAHRRSH